MQVNISAKHMELTEPIESYIRKKAGCLSCHFDRLQQINVVVDRQAGHGFHVEILADVERHADFVANATHDDLYACIDLVVDRTTRQLTDHKERVRDNHGH